MTGKTLLHFGSGRVIAAAEPPGENADPPEAPAETGNPATGPTTRRPPLVAPTGRQRRLRSTPAPSVPARRGHPANCKHKWCYCFDITHPLHPETVCRICRVDQFNKEARDQS